MKLKKVSYVYSEGDAFEKKALDEISLEIPDGQFIGIIGHTGSGKSTLIQHLNGLLRATSGAIYYDGENIYQEGYDMRTLRSKVGLVFQYPEHQLFEVDVFSDVCFGPMNQGMTREQAEEEARKALHHVGFKEENFDKSPFELSGGMCQRVGIAMAMTFQPKLLLADEPTSALDVTTQAQIVRQMMELRDDFGTGIIVVTHNIGVAAYMADKLLVMRQGKVVDSGQREDILHNPQSEYTKNLLASVPALKGERYV